MTRDHKLHRTVYRDPAFQAAMDSTYGFRWRDWPFKLVRRYAKTYLEVKGRRGMTEIKLRSHLSGPGIDDSTINNECICGDLFWKRGQWKPNCPARVEHQRVINDVNYTPPVRFVPLKPLTADQAIHDAAAQKKKDAEKFVDSWMGFLR